MNRIEYVLKKCFNSNGLTDSKQYEDFIETMCAKDFIDGVRCDYVSNEECKMCWNAEVGIELEKELLKKDIEKVKGATIVVNTPKPLPEYGHVGTEAIISEVNHPKHYNQGKYEVIDVIEDWGLNFNLGNALKYIARCEHKNNKKQDLGKALWYIQREINNMEGNY